MVFVHNEDALVDDTVFVENTVEVSTVLMTSPKSKETATTTSNIDSVMPTHIVERSCFLESNVGMSNVLVTDVDSARFGQRDNHASGTKFTWSSKCEGGAAKSNGNDCLKVVVGSVMVRAHTLRVTSVWHPELQEVVDTSSIHPMVWSMVWVKYGHLVALFCLRCGILHHDTHTQHGIANIFLKM